MTSRKISPIEIVNKLLALKSIGQTDAKTEEALWFLQFESTQPGGLDRLAKEITARFPQRIGPDVVQAAFGRKKLSRVEATLFWRSVPERCKGTFAPLVPEAWLLEASDEYSIDDILLDDDDFDDDSQCARERREERARKRRAKQRREEERSCGVPKIELGALHRVITPLVESDVARAFREFCEIPAASKVSCWCFPNWEECLQSLMLERAAAAQISIAKTAVVEKVYDALDFAWDAGVMVQVEGDPRHGKTEAISAYCASHRGRARLVTVPCENSDSDFFVAIAEGLGIEVLNPGNVAAIRRQIDFVLTHARLMIIWDEAHWLLPQRYSETTPPSRMNWLRTRVADRGLATALIITPQSFDEPFRKFIRKTK